MLEKASDKGFLWQNFCSNCQTLIPYLPFQTITGRAIAHFIVDYFFHYWPYLSTLFIMMNLEQKHYILRVTF